MPCWKQPLVKNWDKPRKVRIITPSKYEQNEPSVKQHWKQVVRDLELSYKDEQFWESQCDTVRELVGPTIFQRIAKIFNLPVESTVYEPKSEKSSLVPSEEFYKNDLAHTKIQSEYSMSDYEESEEEESLQKELSELWSVSTMESESDLKRVSRSRSMVKSRSITLSRSISKNISRKSISKYVLPRSSRSLSRYRATRSDLIKSESSIEESAASDDDVRVHPASKYTKRRSRFGSRRYGNPHFDMLYCNESETDMIKWKSKYKQKTFEVSASDEFSKKAEIMTKQIASDFYEWWVSLGNVEFKSEIKRPEDIEDLFQVWFDEHASRGVVLDPKILPCVLQSIANYVKIPRASCPRVLKRQIASDIYAETSPAHTTAFNTCLPRSMKHIPPNNNTKESWQSLQIPEDLRSMACVWEDIQHLTSTKAFQSWLQQRPYLPMPPCLKVDDAVTEKKQLFVVPSDFVFQDKSETSVQELALPVSQFSFELKDVLSKLLNN